MTPDPKLAPEPWPPPKSDRPVRLKDMIFFLYMEGRRIRETQSGVVRSGLAKEPWPEAIYRAEVFEATARFLERIQPVLGKVLELLNSTGVSAKK